MKTERLIRRLAKLFGVRVYFYAEEYRDCAGMFHPKNQTIHIQRESTDEMLSTFFHELGHKHCYDAGLWRLYHWRDYDGTTARYTPRELRGIVRTGLRAEKWVDNWGRETMNLFFPERTYKPGYEDPRSIKWYKDSHLAWFKYALKDNKTIEVTWRKS